MCVLEVVEELGVERERDVERVREARALERQAHRLAHEAGDHVVVHVERQEQTRVASQSAQHLLHRTRETSHSYINTSVVRKSNSSALIRRLYIYNQIRGQRQR